MRISGLFAVALLVGCTSVGNTTRDIAVQEARIGELQSEVEPLVAPLQTTKADVRVFASLEPIVGAIALLSGLPAAQRTMSFQSTATNGHFYDNSDLCDSYVESQGPRDFHASGELTSFKASTEGDGSLLFTAHADISGHVRVRWHFFGVRRFDCPPEGAMGGSVNAAFKTRLDLKIRAEFAMAPDGQSVSYQATISEPRRVAVTIRISVGPFGRLPLPTSFDVSGGPIAAGQFPLLVASGGKVVVSGDTRPREYGLTLKPIAFSSTRAGLVAEWISEVAIKTAPSRG